MNAIFDEMYDRLSQWDEAYARRWLTYMRATHNRLENEAACACRFWSLELAVLNTETVRRIRGHLVPTNHTAVILDIFQFKVMPLLERHPITFKTLSHDWGSTY